jgi:two-component system response regulator (stage 0 sporulation protein A)
MDRKIRVLIADDNLDECAVTKASLEACGFDVCGVAHTGYEVLDAAKEILPDVIVMDLCMPRLDGIGALKGLSALGLPKKIVTIVYSHFDNPELTEYLVRFGATYYMNKNIDFSVLADRILTFMDQDRPEPRSVYRPEALQAAPVMKKINGINLERYVTEIMHDIGVPAHIKGFST